MKNSVIFLVSSFALVSCGGLSALNEKSSKNSEDSITESVSENQTPAADATPVETGSISFDLSQVVFEQKGNGPGLALTSLPIPAPLYGRFEFVITGKSGNSEWSKAFTFSADKKEVLLTALPIGEVKVLLTAFDSNGVAFKSGAADAIVQAGRVTQLTLVLKKIGTLDGTGSIEIRVVDEVVCTQVAGTLYSTKDASLVPFTDGCQRNDLLKSGAAVTLDQIPRLFAKGEICTQVVSKWKHPKSGEVVSASNGCQAAGLQSLGFIKVQN